METEQLRIIDINQYWPRIVGQTEEFKAIAEAENPEFNLANEALYRCLKDNFILEATEYGVSRWEKMLDLTVPAGATLDERKEAIIAYLSVKLPYTVRVLREMLNTVLGGDFKMSIDNDTQILTILYGLAVSEIPQKTVEELVERVIPANLVVDYGYDVPTIINIFKNRVLELLGDDVKLSIDNATQTIDLAYTSDVTNEQISRVEELRSEVLPTDVVVEHEQFPLDYTRVEFLEGTGTQYIKLTGTVDKNTGVEIDYQQTDIGSFQLFEVIGTRVPKGGVFYFWFVPRAANANGTAVEWFYFRQNFRLTTNAFARQKVQQNYFNSRKTIVPKEDGSEAQYSLSEGAEGVVLPSFGLYKGNSLIAHARIWSVNITQDQAYSFKLLPALDSSGTPCMFDLVTRKPFYNSGSGQFIAGFNMAQAESLGALLPANTTLTVSLPWEASLVQHNDKVEVALDEASENGCTLAVRYREPEKDSPIYNKYAECKTAADIAAVNPDYKTDLTEDGAWEYPLTSMTAFRNTSDWWTGIFAGSPIKKMNGVFPACTYCHAILSGAHQIEEYDLEFPIATRVSATSNQSVTVKKARLVAPEATFMERCFYWNTHLSDLYVYAPKVKSMGLMFADAQVLAEIKGEFGAEATSLDNAFARCYKLQVFPTYYPKASTAAGMLNECRISAESAIAILDSIPTWTSGSHALTLGIHIDHQNDEEVVAAITAAEEKGWTVTVQWNGTPTAQTASTFGLRKPPIYAKLAAVEHPDGTIENFLDWGHYVSNAEENGYQEFASKEEAYEHFNLEMETEE